MRVEKKNETQTRWRIMPQWAKNEKKCNKKLCICFSFTQNAPLELRSIRKILKKRDFSPCVKQ